MKNTRQEREEKIRLAHESLARIIRAQNETRAIVAGGICPLCGAGFRQNSSIKGWWQCEQLGAQAFRKDAEKPSCRWQGFTE